MFQQNLEDTAARDFREAGKGTVTTKPGGATRVNDGPYKGLTKPAMEQHILTGAPVPTGKSGYVRGGPLTPDRGSSTSSSTPRRGLVMPSMFDGPSMAGPAAMPKLPVPGVAPGMAAVANVAAQAGNTAIAKNNASQSQGAAPAIARAYMDNKHMGITGRDADGVRFDSGAHIIPGAGGSKSLVSPHGSGSVTFLPQGQRASDPVLAAEIAATKARQAQGTFTPAPATPGYAARAGGLKMPTPPVAAPTAPPAPTPTVVQQQPATAAAPPRGLQMPPAAMRTFPAGSPLADVNQGPPKLFAPTQPPATAPATRPVDPALVDPRGFGNPVPTNPANFDWKPQPPKISDSIRNIAGRGDDGFARALQVMNPLTVFQTLKQGGNSALPSVMGPQPTYANANDRLKGDADVVKGAHAAGQIKTLKMPDPFGGSPKTAVLTPTLRETGQPVTPWSAAKNTPPSAGTTRPATSLQPPQVLSAR